LDVSYLKKKHEITTNTLDLFLKEQRIQSVDFIKIDVQGAELETFKGAKKILKTTLCIVSEVEFIPLYKDQPLFGDVSGYLDSQGFMFHKFLGFGGRALKPIILNNNVNTASQYMWSDAVFIRHLEQYQCFSSDDLLKAAMISYVYGSPDLTLYCLKIYDEREQTDLFKHLFEALGC